MSDSSVAPRLGNMKALFGILAGAGASYGLYKLISGGSVKKNKKGTVSESTGVSRNEPGEVSLQPGSLLAKVSGLDVVCARPVTTMSVDVASGKHHGYPGYICLICRAVRVNVTYSLQCLALGPFLCCQIGSSHYSPFSRELGTTALENAAVLPANQQQSRGQMPHSSYSRKCFCLYR